MHKVGIKEYEEDFCVYAEERSGGGGKRFFRRGFPFAQGILRDEKAFYLRGEDNNVPAIATEVLERYADGSIRWLSVAFVQELKFYQSYCLKGVFEKRKDIGKNVAEESKNGVLLKSDSVEVLIGKNGVTSIVSGKKEYLGKKGIRLSVRDDKGKHYFAANECRIYINNAVYATARLTGTFKDSKMCADWFITMYKGDNKLSHEVKFYSKGINVLFSEAIETDFADDMIEHNYKERAEIVDNLVFTDWFSVSDNAEKSVLFTSKDVTRFYKTTAPTGVHNGYATEGKNIVFSPIQYDLGFEWPDGVGRTIHLDMLLSDKTFSKEAVDNELRWTFSEPLLRIPAKWFVLNGAIDGDSQSEAISRMGRMLGNLYGFYWNHFEAGKLPNTMRFDHVSEQVTAPGKMDRSHGAVGYNLWRTYMNYSDPKMYDINLDYAEHWTDNIQYRGEIKELYGANRYHSGDYFNDHESFCTSMPYYGDLSGLYMTYCMTGNPYYKQAFKEGIDFITEDTEKNQVPLLSYWTSTMFAVHKSPEFQTRCCVVTRCLWFAYRIFGDERYVNAAKSIMRWMAEAQNANGSFNESYYYDTKELIYIWVNGERRSLEKQYIMLWGARGVVEYCKESGDEIAIRVMEKLFDYIIDSMDEQGFLWYPNNRDEAAYDAGVKGARGSCGATTASGIYAIGVFYDIVKKPEYLKAVLKMVRYCMATWGMEGSGGQLQGSATPYLQGLQTAYKLIQENMDFVLEEGFADVVALLDTNTKETFCQYPRFNNRFHRFSLNTFDTVWGKEVYFLHRQNAMHGGGTHQNHAFDFEFELSRDRRLWYGDTIRVSRGSDRVMIKKPIRVVELIYLLQTDITVSNLTGEAVVKITHYTPDRITIHLECGSGFDATVTDGYFHVDDSATYMVQQNERIIEVKPQEGVLHFALIPGTNTEVTISKKS